ncbi:hypothetical protein Hanom_Chr09g00806181 [Helianthus anomalus]
MVRKIKVNKEGRIMGVPYGGIWVVSDAEGCDDAETRVDTWQNRFVKTSISCKMIVDKIRENSYGDEETFKMDFAMLFITTMIASTKNRNAMYTMLGWFCLTKEFREHDWCQVIIDTIRVCKSDWDRNDRDSVFRGPLTVLVLAISVIDKMHASESFIEFSDNPDFLKKTIPFKVKDVFVKYLRSVHHPKCLEFELVIPKRLEIEWATVGNSVDCGVFAMRRMETSFAETILKWDSGFPLAHTQKKSGLTRLRKKYACKIVCHDVNKWRNEVMGATVAWNLAEGYEVEKGMDVNKN